MARILRDPSYLIGLAILMGVIGLSVAFGSGSSSAEGGTPELTAAATEVPTVTPAPTAVPTATLAEVLLDSRRGIDLEKNRDALEKYRAKFGRYPSSEGLFTQFCNLAFDPGCQLLSVTKEISGGDGQYPYWYRSDGKTYTLFAEVAVPIARNGCPRELPPLLIDVPVLCAGSSEGTP